MENPSNAKPQEQPPNGPLLKKEKDPPNSQSLQPAEFLNLFHHPIFVIDRNYQLVFTNNYALSFIQKEFKKTDKRKCYEIIYNRTTPCAYCPINELLNNDDATKIIAFQSKTFQIGFHTDGSEPWQLLIEEIRDITKEREERESEIRIFNLASIGTLISGIAHELNNPLTGLNLNLQNLIANLKTSSANTIQQRLQLMQEDVHRSLKIIGDILSITSPHRARFLTTNFRQTILRAVDTIRRLYPELSRRIHWDIDGSPLQFAYQSEKMERLFVNLFRNSLQKYDYREGLVAIKWSVLDKKRCYIEVTDHAGGIDEGTIKKLFLPFQRPSSNQQGSGLGLTVCLRIVQEHSGTITVASQNEKTIFKIQIPMDLS